MDALNVVEVPEAADAPESPPAASDGVAVFPPSRAPGRPRGYAKTGGRKKGSKNRRTLEVEKALRPLLPAAKRKLKTLMASDDDKVAYSAVMGIFAYIYGRPIDRKELSGPDGAPLIEPTRYEELHGKVEVARRVLAAIREGEEAQKDLEAIGTSLDPKRRSAFAEGSTLSLPGPAPEPEPEPEPETATEEPEQPTDPPLPKHPHIFLEEGERERSGERAWLAMERPHQILKTFHSADARQTARDWVLEKFNALPADEIEVPLPDEDM